MACLASSSSITRDDGDGDVLGALERLGVDIVAPRGAREEAFASSLERFSEFVLEGERELCLGILDAHLERDDGSVGELQGGSDAHRIYRAVLPDDDGGDGGDGGAVAALLRAFRSSPAGRGEALTAAKLRRAMLDGCGRAERLGNVMLVMAFGPVPGQLRHIDGMDPNLQLCLYMTPDCPSTVCYEMDGPAVDDAATLAARWRADGRAAPAAVIAVLRARASLPLAATWWTRAFAGSLGPTLDEGLRRFGKLYQRVARALATDVDAGTLLVAGGNEVHAGPRTARPRMFAFAVGIPEGHGGDASDGEVQYNPVLLHVDVRAAKESENSNFKGSYLGRFPLVSADFWTSDHLSERSRSVDPFFGTHVEATLNHPFAAQVDVCCVLFGDLDFGPVAHDGAPEAKRFLLGVLADAVRDAPHAEAYERQLGDDRAELRSWLAELARAVGDARAVDALLAAAAASESLLFAPDVAKKRKKRKYNKRR